MNLLICGVDPGRLTYLIAALSSVVERNSIVIVEDPEPVKEKDAFERLREFQVNQVRNFASDMIDRLREMPPKQEQEPEYSGDDSRLMSIQGQEELTAWLVFRVRWVLSAFGRARRTIARTIHQPCWRAGRWKSLT